MERMVPDTLAVELQHRNAEMERHLLKFFVDVVREEQRVEIAEPLRLPVAGGEHAELEVPPAKLIEQNLAEHPGGLIEDILLEVLDGVADQAALFPAVVHIGAAARFPDDQLPLGEQIQRPVAGHERDLVVPGDLPGGKFYPRPNVPLLNRLFDFFRDLNVRHFSHLLSLYCKCVLRNALNAL